jgi:hypothetical protein
MTLGAAAEAIDITFDSAWRGTGSARRVTPTPQRLRQSYASVHHADLVPIEDIRATLGQSLGESVLHLHYLIDDVDLKASERIAEATQAQLVDALGGRIMIATAVSCTTARQPALAERSGEIDAALFDAGWLTTGTPDGDWLGVVDAASCLGVSEVQVRRDIRAGKLPAISSPRNDQKGIRYLVSTPDLLEHEADSPASEMAALAEEVGVSYDVVRQLVRRHEDLELERRPGRRAGTLSVEAKAYVREYFAEQEALRERAVRLTDVAKDLGLSVAAVDTIIRCGQLTEDVRFHGGFRSLTRASVEEFVLRPPRRRGRR